MFAVISFIILFLVASIIAGTVTALFPFFFPIPQIIIYGFFGGIWYSFISLKESERTQSCLGCLSLIIMIIICGIIYFNNNYKKTTFQNSNFEEKQTTESTEKFIKNENDYNLKNNIDYNSYDNYEEQYLENDVEYNNYEEPHFEEEISEVENKTYETDNRNNDYEFITDPTGREFRFYEDYRGDTSIMQIDTDCTDKKVIKFLDNLPQESDFYIRMEDKNIPVFFQYYEENGTLVITFYQNLSLKEHKNFIPVFKKESIKVLNNLLNYNFSEITQRSNDIYLNIH